MTCYFPETEGSWTDVEGDYARNEMQQAVDSEVSLTQTIASISRIDESGIQVLLPRGTLHRLPSPLLCGKHDGVYHFNTKVEWISYAVEVILGVRVPCDR
ncbi:hypothetical protein KEM54_000139 [Ascosphaera aggregata]|nr:hypothetical protein KEM54_000139 [Ascosphaera aggregata]